MNLLIALANKVATYTAALMACETFLIVIVISVIISFNIFECVCVFLRSNFRLNGHLVI